MHMHKTVLIVPAFVTLAAAMCATGCSNHEPKYAEVRQEHDGRRVNVDVSRHSVNVWVDDDEDPVDINVWWP
jgi:hypothetical protein